MTLKQKIFGALASLLFMTGNAHAFSYDFGTDPTTLSGSFALPTGFSANALSFQLTTPSNANFSVWTSSPFSMAIGQLYEGVFNPIAQIFAYGVTPSYYNLDLAAGNYAFFIYGASFVSGSTFNIDGVVTAVPEPETYLMLLAGLAMIGFVMRRRAAD